MHQQVLQLPEGLSQALGFLRSRSFDYSLEKCNQTTLRAGNDLDQFPALFAPGIEDFGFFMQK
jgi:hypothetical protein